MFLLIGLFLLVLKASNAEAQVGVCYGRKGDNLPSAGDVVQLYNQNGIGKMRIYSPETEVLNALRGSNIELIVGVDDKDLAQLASSPAAAATWVQNNIRDYSDVNFKYIAVGNEVLPDNPNAQYISAAMENLQSAISAAGFGDRIKVSTATFTAILGVSYPPSHGSFRDDAKPFMKPIIDFLVRSNAPLLVNIYPYIAYVGDHDHKIQLDYALFNSPGNAVQDGPLGYQNLFDAMLDAHYTALEEEGGGNVEIVVSESGWPSDGNPPAASSQNAGTYYANLINHAKSGAGTPKRPGKVTETYLFAMFDENQKPGDETEKHFGLFSPTKEPKYSISFN